MPFTRVESWRLPIRRKALGVQAGSRVPTVPGEVPRGEELQGSGVGVAGTGDIYPAGAPATFALTTGGPCGGGSSQTRPTDSPSAPVGRGAGSEPTDSNGTRSRPSSIA